MKKVMVFIIVFLLLAPACFAETDESQYIGTWVYSEETSNQGLCLEVLHLSSDHKVFFLRQMYNATESTYGRKTVGHWEVSDDGLHISTGEGYPEYYNAVQPDLYIPALSLYYPSGDEYKIYVAISSDMITRIANDKLSALNNAKESNASETGVFVPGGYWDVGVDIPAGVYSIRKPDNINSQNFVVYEKYNEESGRYTRTLVNTILNNNNPIIGKVTLREGNIVWVDEGVYFDSPVRLGF